MSGAVPGTSQGGIKQTRIALVTGATDGIGQHTAKKLAGSGFKVTNNALHIFVKPVQGVLCGIKCFSDKGYPVGCFGHAIKVERTRGLS